MTNKDRVYNFSAGPSMLPEEVLTEVSASLMNYGGSGQSVMEMSHRSKEFKEILDDARSNLKELLKVPDSYDILFLQGGGTLQFSMVPLNLMGKVGKADYVITGSWAKKAYKEGIRLGDARVIASSEDANFTYIPKINREDVDEDADYVYITYNNTIYGTHYPYVPDTGNIPLVADMSSCILSEEIDVAKFGLIFAGAQKNIGPAGLTIVIVRKDLLGKARPDVPVYLDYSLHAEADSTYNTPPCFSIYVAGEVFKYLKKRGGVKAVHQVNVEKAKLLYDYIDSSNLYSCPVAEEDRSLMTVVFVTGNKELDKEFVQEAKKEGLINLNGHRSVGGMRAGIFNAMPVEGVKKLIDFMKKFEEVNK